MLRSALRPALAATALLAAVPTLLIAAAPAEDATTPPVVQSRTVEVRVEHGEMNVIVDGQPVPADRIRRLDGGLEILDDRGRPMRNVVIQIPGAGQVPAGFRPEGVVGGLRVIPEGSPDISVDETRTMVFVGPDGTPQVIDAGEFRWSPAPPPRPMLGIRMENAEKGVRVVEVIPGTPAAKAGLQAGDTILTAGEGTLTTDRLLEKMKGFKPGQTVQMWILRGDEKREITATLEPWRPELGGDGGTQQMEIRVERIESNREDDDHGHDGPGAHGGHGPVDPHRILEVLRDHLPELFAGGEVEVDIDVVDDEIEIEIHIEVEGDPHRGDDDEDDDDRDHDARHGWMDGDGHAEAMEAFHRQVEHHAEAMHREFEARWPEVERELEHRLEDFARTWSRQGDEFARGLESRLRAFGEGGERLARELEAAMNRREAEGEQFGRRVAEALRRSEERNQVLEERVSRLEAMLERMMRRQPATPARPADAPAGDADRPDRPTPPDRPGRRGGRRGDAPPRPAANDA